MWFRVSRRPDDPSQALGRFVGGKVMVMLNRDEYWQCGYVIAKGTLDHVKQRGIEAFRHEMSRQINLKLIRCREFSNGCVMLLYRVKHQRKK